jgi:hypothetical protein
MVVEREGLADGGSKVLYHVWETDLGLKTHRASEPGRIGWGVYIHRF